MGARLTRFWVSSYDFYPSPDPQDLYLETPEHSDDEKHDENMEDSENEENNGEIDDEGDSDRGEVNNNNNNNNVDENSKNGSIDIENERIDTKKELLVTSDSEEEKQIEDKNKSDSDSDFEFPNSSDNEMSDDENNDFLDDYSGSDKENQNQERPEKRGHSHSSDEEQQKQEKPKVLKRIEKEEYNALTNSEKIKYHIESELWLEEWSTLSKELASVNIDEHTTIAQLQVNKNKSNYSQYFTFDETRVHLSSKNEEGSDYVNASHIQLPAANCHYIAAGAPSEDSIEDFWRMVWENDIKVIVMLTKLVESGRLKSAQYWPSPILFNSDDDEEEDIFDFTDDDDYVLAENVYGDYTVQLKYQNTGDIHKDITQRTFKILKDACKYENEEDCESKMVTQFHYSGWPDHGVPKNLEGVCKLIMKIHSIYSGESSASSVSSSASTTSEVDNNKSDDNACNDSHNNNDCDDGKEEGSSKKNHRMGGNSDLANVVVHCSAGIGRTGTFLVIHSQISKILKEMKVGNFTGNDFGVFETVRCLRAQRYFMIQTEEQYLLCYKTLLSLLENNSTTIEK